MDKKYVKEILDAAKKQPPMSREAFALFTHLDVVGGYQREADEAMRQYFSGEVHVA